MLQTDCELLDEEGVAQETHVSRPPDETVEVFLIDAEDHVDAAYLHR
jgi:hypothetical protein